MNKSSVSWLMFLIGLFSQTQIRVVGSIAISELAIFLIAPFVMIAYHGIFRREKVSWTLNLLVLAMIGCVISSWANHTPFLAAIRGFAAPYGFWAGIVVLYAILRRAPMSFKWYLLGSAISFVLCTFFFQQAVESNVAEGVAQGTSAERIMEGPIYWIGRLNGFVMWPIQGAYLQTPFFYSVVASFVFGAWSMLTSASGRSTALVAVASSILILIGGKTKKTIRRVKKCFFPLMLGGVVFLFVFKSLYTAAATSGKLGEDARTKIEGQTKGKTDMLSVLMGGRLPVFIGGYACLQKPFVGYGPWALDDSGFVEEFMRKYGNVEDYEDMLKSEADLARFGVRRYRLLPSHSAIIGWWLWYGILGLPIWIYILYLMYDMIHYRVSAVPAFFGLFATLLPSYLWGLFFSPFGARMPWAFLITMLLINRTLDEHQKKFGYVVLEGGMH